MAARATPRRWIYRAALAAHPAPAFGFFNGGFASNPRAPEVIAAWRRAGLPLGNHSWSHGNLDATTAPAYLANTRRDEPVLAPAAAAAARGIALPASAPLPDASVCA